MILFQDASALRARFPFLGSAGASPAVSRASRDTLRDSTNSQPIEPLHPLPARVFGEAPKTAGEAPALPGREIAFAPRNLLLALVFKLR